MKAAVTARQGSELKVLAVTVLTSYDDIDLAESGYGMSVDDAGGAPRAAGARLGVDGLVCSPEEASPLRLVVGDRDGARDARHPPGRQRRAATRSASMTPAQAIAAGADYLVVGRPITGAADPKKAADAIVAEIAAAGK